MLSKNERFFADSFIDKTKCMSEHDQYCYLTAVFPNLQDRGLSILDNVWFLGTNEVLG